MIFQECDDKLNLLIQNKMTALANTEGLEGEINQKKTDIEKLEREAEKSNQFIANWQDQLKKVLQIE